MEFERLVTRDSREVDSLLIERSLQGGGAANNWPEEQRKYRSFTTYKGRGHPTLGQAWWKVFC